MSSKTREVFDQMNLPSNQCRYLKKMAFTGSVWRSKGEFYLFIGDGPKLEVALAWIKKPVTNPEDYVWPIHFYSVLNNLSGITYKLIEGYGLNSTYQALFTHYGRNDKAMLN